MKNTILLLLSFLIFSCASSEYIKISPEEAYSKFLNESATIIDVRESFEYDESHIKCAQSIPLSSLENDIKKIKNKKTTLLVYCRSGNRSKTACDTLIKLGYKNVYDFGGINEWPYEINYGPSK